MRTFLLVTFFFLFGLTCMSQDTTKTYVYKNKTWVIKYTDTLTPNRIVIRNGSPIFIDSFNNRLDSTTFALLSCDMEYNISGDIIPNSMVAKASTTIFYDIATRKKVHKISFKNIKLGLSSTGTMIKIANFDLIEIKK